MISRQQLKLGYGLLLLLALLLPPVVVFSGLAVAPVVAIFLIVLLLEGTLKNAMQPPFNRVIAITIVLAGWILASCFWAPNRDHAFTAWSLSFGVIVMAMLSVGVLSHLRRGQLERISQMLMISIPLMLLLIVIELKSYGAIHQFFNDRFFHKPAAYFNAEVYNRGACFLAVFFWALVMSKSRDLRLKQGGIGIFLLLLGGLTLLTLIWLESLSAKVAFAASVVMFFATCLLPRLSVRLLQAGVIVLAVLLVWQAPKLKPVQYLQENTLPPSALHRIFIWQFSAQKAQQNTLEGHGFYASRYITGAKDPITLPAQSAPVGWVNLPNHPHNGMLQMWLETGLFGLSLYVLTIVLILGWIADRVESPVQKAALAAMATAYFVISQLAFNIWAEWWVATGLISFILMRLFVDGFIELPPSPRGGRMLLR